MRISAVVVAVTAVVGGCSKTTAPKTESSIDCAVGEVRASPAEATLHPGDTVGVHAIVSFCPGDPLTPTFLWRSSDTSVAIVDSVAGLARAKSAGRATLVAAATVNPQISVATVLTVVPQ